MHGRDRVTKLCRTRGVKFSAYASSLVYGFNGPLGKFRFGQGLHGYVNRAGDLVWKDKE